MGEQGVPQEDFDSAHQKRSPLRIVAADDDRDAVLMLSQLLLQEGHLVREVYRGDAVVEMVRQFEPDAVLLDIGMPGMTGLDVARTLRARMGPACPLLIAITGWNKGADRILAQMAGFHHYLVKPYEPQQLLQLLEPLSVRPIERS